MLERLRPRWSGIPGLELPLERIFHIGVPWRNGGLGAVENLRAIGNPGILMKRTARWDASPLFFAEKVLVCAEFPGCHP